MNQSKWSWDIFLFLSTVLFLTTVPVVLDVQTCLDWLCLALAMLMPEWDKFPVTTTLKKIRITWKSLIFFAHYFRKCNSHLKNILYTQWNSSSVFLQRMKTPISESQKIILHVVLISKDVWSRNVRLLKSVSSCAVTPSLQSDSEHIYMNPEQQSRCMSFVLDWISSFILRVLPFIFFTPHFNN